MPFKEQGADSAIGLDQAIDSYIIGLICRFQIYLLAEPFVLRLVVSFWFLGPALRLSSVGAFSVIGPSTWNELPLTLRLLPQNNMSSFCKLLKTFLFDYSWTESASE